MKGEFKLWLKLDPKHGWCCILCINSTCTHFSEPSHVTHNATTLLNLTTTYVLILG